MDGGVDDVGSADWRPVDEATLGGVDIVLSTQVESDESRRHFLFRSANECPANDRFDMFNEQFGVELDDDRNWLKSDYRGFGVGETRLWRCVTIYIRTGF